MVSMVDMNALPLDQRVNFGTITPLAAWFKMSAVWHLALCSRFWLVSSRWRSETARRWQSVCRRYDCFSRENQVSLVRLPWRQVLLPDIDSGASESVRESSRGTGKDCSGPDLPGCGFVLLIGLVMSFVVEPVMGAINMALNNGPSSMGGSSKLILGFVLAAMMAIDMGGPFNKAAYVFGTAAIASGNYDVMAAGAMIGGMTPPFAIALATMLFKQLKFTKEARGRTDQLHHGSGHSSRRARFHLQRPIRYTCFQPASSVPGVAGGSDEHVI